MFERCVLPSICIDFNNDKSDSTDDIPIIS